MSKYWKVIGTSTRKVKFGCSFELTDEHVNDIVAMGAPVCRGITEFEFVHGDVGYSAPNSNLLSSAGLITLASSLPSLKKLILPNSPGTSDEAFLHLLASFPALTHIEINGVSSITSASFEALQTQSNLLPNLKSLTLSFPRYAENEKVFEKAMRAMGRVRTKLVVGFKNNHEEKNFQDWDLVWDITKYKNGRKMKESMKDYGMNDAAGMYGDDGGYGGGFGRYMYSY